MSSRGWRGAVCYGLPGLLLGMLLIGGFGGDRGAVVRAQAENLPGMERPRVIVPATGDASNTIAFTSAAGAAGQFLYLIDARTRALAIYRVDPTNPKGTLKLEAARQCQWDLKLAEYNNLGISANEVEKSIKALGHLTR